MNRFDKIYVQSCADWLDADQITDVYEHIHATWPSLDSCYPNDIRMVARQMYPEVREKRVAPISSEDMARVNQFRIDEAAASLVAAQKWLSKVRNPSDTVGIAIRDIGMIADQLEGVKQ